MMIVASFGVNNSNNNPRDFSLTKRLPYIEFLELNLLNIYTNSFLSSSSSSVFFLPLSLFPFLQYTTIFPVCRARNFTFSRCFNAPVNYVRWFDRRAILCVMRFSPLNVQTPCKIFLRCILARFVLMSILELTMRYSPAASALVIAYI